MNVPMELQADDEWIKAAITIPIRMDESSSKDTQKLVVRVLYFLTTILHQIATFLAQTLQPRAIAIIIKVELLR